MVRAICIIFLLVLACAPRVRVSDARKCDGHCAVRIVYHVDGDFSSEEVRDIDEGFEVWRRGTRGRACFDAYMGDGSIDLFVRRARETSLPFLPDGVTRAGGAYHGNTIHLSDRLRPAHRVTIAAHEVGHALGLQHDASKGSVMQPTGMVLDRGELPAVDAKSFCARYVCRCPLK